MMFSIVSLFVGLAIGVPSDVTWSRRWTGMLAGFDPGRCTDIDGLARRVGRAGIALCGLYVLAAAAAYLVPESIGAVSVVVAVGSVVGLGVTMSACSRFTRR